MLVLTRKVGEKIVFQTPQGDIEVTVVKIRNGAVRIGVEGPRGIQVMRKELMEKEAQNPESGVK